MLQTLTRSRDATGTRPGSRECLDGRVLTAAGHGVAARWREGDRLEHVYEARCDWLRQHGQAGRLAADAGDITLTYRELDARANQLARFLVRRGVQPGDRIGLLFDRAVDSYVAMLAVLKAHAAYVPLDAAFPADRLAFITADAALRLVLTHSRLAGAGAGAGAGLICVDQAADLVAAEPAHRLGTDEVAAPTDDLCYVIYTSGTTGRPKGVAISHASICNFVRVAAEVYGITGEDRVYQGMTIAFDFSVEEDLGALGHRRHPGTQARRAQPAGPGAGRVPGRPPDHRAVLRAELLATLEDDHPRLRFLLVSG